jgi:uncharacterized protein (TIGR03083 family)
MSSQTAIWRMPTRAEAIEILVACRARTEALIDGLDEKQMKTRTLLGGGDWSVKDLLGHLAGYEEDALAFVTGERPRRAHKFASVDERNAAEIERKRSWSVRRVRQDSQRVRAAFLTSIENMDDERWKGKVETQQGRSALGLVLGRLLVGGRHGLFAHDLAHIRDLERSVKSLKNP